MSFEVIGTYSMSDQQRRIYRLDADTGAFRAQCVVIVDGALEIPALRQAVQMAIRRHDILRTTFEILPGLKFPLPSMHEMLDAGFEQCVMAGCDRRDLQQLSFNLLSQVSARFEFDRGPLLRVAVAQVAPERHLMSLSLPALCADSITLGNLVNEIGHCYLCVEKGAQPGGTPLPYADYTAWQEALLQEPDRSGALGRAFWSNQSLAHSQPLTFPLIKRGETFDCLPEIRGFEFGAELTAAIDRVTEQLEISPRAVLMACWAALLWRLTGQNELIVGEVFDGRQYQEFEDACGPYARTLPLRATLKGAQRFSRFAQRIQQIQEAAAEWQDYAPADSESQFQVVFDYSEWPSPVTAASLTFTLLRRTVHLERFQLKLACFRDRGLFRGELHFNPSVFDRIEIERTEERFLALLRAAVKNPDQHAGTLPALGAGEFQEFVHRFNDTRQDFPDHNGVHQMFEDVVRRMPDAMAVVAGSQQLTFGELNRRANQLAHFLRSFGPDVEPRVGILLTRSADVIVAIIGILKAGGAYLPLDTAAPKERLANQLIDAGVSLVLTEPEMAQFLPPGEDLKSIFLHSPQIAQSSEESPTPPAIGASLAYVLFTSGSTGRPKGVAVEHRQLLNYINAIRLKLALPERATYATVSTFAADLGNTVVFSALCGGGCLHIVSQDISTDPAAFAKYMRSRGIDCLKIVPSHLAALIISSDPQDMLPRTLLVMGGEAAPLRLVADLNRIAPRLRIMNHYGPTETTVGVMTLESGGDVNHLASTSLPLGRPLANCEIYTLDPRLEPVPAGAAGELFIGGANVARGYIGRPDLTAERSIPHPLSRAPGERLYRTGDLARMLPEGVIEFLGRIDNQVKIRGFRIEPGEVEAALANHQDVLKAVVDVAHTVADEKQLVAYVVARRGASPSKMGLRDFLADSLPDYMLPSAIVFLDALPLTPNGKLDRIALPPLERAVVRSGESAASPRTPEEEALLEIWIEVLGIPDLGIHDNFFEVGGDSILAIQVASRANRRGLHLKPKHIFEGQTIADLAKAASTAVTPQIEQSPLTGETPLTPIQRWFFEQDFIAPHHWNQSMSLEAPRTLEPDMLKTAVRHLIGHQDGLRSRFEPSPQGWRQFIVSMEEAPDCFEFVNLSALHEPERTDRLRSALERIQSSLNLLSGPVARFALFDLGASNSKRRLVIVIHHLVVDGVSWRILLEDLQMACEQLLRSQPVELPPRSSSLRQWGERLIDFARSAELAAELPFWLNQISPVEWRLPKDHHGVNTIASARNILTSLNAAETKILLYRLPELYGAHIDELLLAALIKSFQLSEGAEVLRIDLEGHGREALFEEIDLSRTVGWFTTHYPVLFDIGGVESLQDGLKRIKSQMRRVPARGIGYGVLKYLSDNQQYRDGLYALPAAEIKFNYLGQFDQVITASSDWAISPETAGAERDALSMRTHLIDVNGLVLGGVLHLRWTYSENVHDHSRILSLAERTIEQLRILIERRRDLQAESYSPSDFPLADLDDQRLNRLLQTLQPDVSPQASGRDEGRRRVVDIYPVSPLQESLLIHTLTIQASSAGFEQKSFLLNGELDLAAFKRTWQEVLDRHMILRTAFVMDGVFTPLQVVLQGIRIPIEYFDWRDLNEMNQREKLRLYLSEDLARGFDPARPPLMRLAVARLAERSYQLVWSYHHLLLDAWCRNLLLEEVFRLYEAYRSGRIPEPRQSPPYRDYIGWLQKQDRSAAERFWREVMSGYCRRLNLPLDRPDRSKEQPGIATTVHTLEFASDETQAVESFTRRGKVTLNTLIHGAWAILLGRYCGTDDVMFGATVSGRPPDLLGSEAILGMFINNLPVRARLRGRGSAMVFLRDLQNSLLAMREYEWASPLQIQEWSEMPPGQRLFQSLLVFQNYPVADSAVGERGGLRILDYQSRLETAYPLTLVVGPFDPLTIRIFYDAHRFEGAAVARLAEHLGTLIHGLAASPAAHIDDAPMIPDRQRKNLLEELRKPTPQEIGCSTVGGLIESQARFRPDGVAVRFGQESLTWYELNERSELVALRLRAAGSNPWEIISVLLPEGPELLIGLLGALKAGVGFLIVDSPEPDPRMTPAISGFSQTILTSRQFNAAVSGSSRRIVVMDGEPCESRDRIGQRPDVAAYSVAYWRLGAASIAGVSHTTLMNQVRAFGMLVEPGPADSFVAAVASRELAAIEMLKALANGMSVILPHEGALESAEQLERLIWATGVTTLETSPSIWKRLVESGWKDDGRLKAIYLGEMLSAWTARALSTNTARLIRVYWGDGCGLWWAARLVNKNDSEEEPSLIGAAIDGNKIVLLLPNLEPAPTGVEGEIYLQTSDGDLGWVGKPGRAAERFIPDLMSHTPGARLYRSGEYGRRRKDGSLEYRGSAQARVSIGNHDVNAFEVASELSKFPAMRELAVTAWTDAAGEDHLAAYFVAPAEELPDVEELSAFARTRLPRYAVPDIYVRLDELVRMPDGRPDLELLPSPDEASGNIEISYTSRGDTLQMRLKQIWEELFGIRPIGSKEDFFELGGHSLLAVRLMSEIRKQFNRDLPLSTLLKGSTIEYLAEVLRAETEPEQWSPLVKIRDGKTRLPLFCVHPMGGEVVCYSEMARHLGPDQPFYGLQSRAWADAEQVASSVEEMAAYYLEAVREARPGGPYLLAGWSFGGIVALEMAQQLHSAGEEIALLAILDTNIHKQFEPLADADRQIEESNFDWASMILRFARRGVSVSMDELRRLKTLEQQVAYAIEQGILPLDIDAATAIRYARAGLGNSIIKDSYLPKSYPGKVTLFRARHGHVLSCPDPTLGWGRIAVGGVEIHDIPGVHDLIVEKPYVQALAVKLRNCLNRIMEDRDSKLW